MERARTHPLYLTVFVLKICLNCEDELMRSIHGVKEILQAKWAGAQGGAGHEELSEEAEKILKKAGSK